MRVEIEAPLRPTEDPMKVEAAVTAFFPDAVAAVEDGRVGAEGHVLDALRERIWQQRIIDTFRAALLAGARGDTVVVHLNKQAASQGKLSLPVSPHPLGDVEITFYVEDGDPWEDAEALAWWLCPETRDGEIVGPTD